MDIVAHGLWAGAAVVALAPRRRPTRGVLGATVALGVLPDLVHMLPVVAWAIATRDASSAWQYAIATPGHGPAMPDLVQLLAHHLHCLLHSAVVAALVTVVVAWRWQRFWWPLLGWWLHIVIDVFTHSADFYPSPVFYPLTYWGFDGVAWNQPVFQLANYLALAGACGWLWVSRSRADP